MGDFYLVSLCYAIAVLVFCAGIFQCSNLVQICHALGRAQINPTKAGVILGWKQSSLLQQGLGKGNGQGPPGFAPFPSVGALTPVVSML